MHYFLWNFLHFYLVKRKIVGPLQIILLKDSPRPEVTFPYQSVQWQIFMVCFIQHQHSVTFLYHKSVPLTIHSEIDIPATKAFTVFFISIFFSKRFLFHKYRETLFYDKHQRFTMNRLSRQWLCNWEHSNVALYFFDTSPRGFTGRKQKIPTHPEGSIGTVFGLTVCWRVAALAPEVLRQVSSACTRSRSIHCYSSRWSHPERVFGRVRLHGPCVCFRYSVCVDLRSVFLSRLSVDTVGHFRTPLARLPGQDPSSERHRYLQALDMASVSAQSQAASAQSAPLQRGIVKMVGIACHLNVWAHTVCM